MLKTLYEKVWDSHVVDEQLNGTTILYIDRHLIHEVTSPQAFEGLKEANRSVRCPHKILAVADHNTPTEKGIVETEESRLQLETLASNTDFHGIEFYPLGSVNNGVCHIVAPDLGFTLPGTTVVCGDSHTATHGAFGAIAFGIGTSEVEHVLATQTLLQKKAKNMRILVQGKLGEFVTPKDVILYIIGRIGTAGGTGYAIEFAGDVIETMSMEGRMTMCNMTIEAGARVGMIAPDQTTYDYLQKTVKAPQGDLWDQAVEFWQTLKSDDGVIFDREIRIDAACIFPQITWGTSPEDVLDILGKIPEIQNGMKQRSLDYMGLEAGMAVNAIKIDTVFIGSCTNGRLEDLQAAAKVLKGRKIASHVRALVVPGSEAVKNLAEKTGLDKIFKDAGFEWRNPGCSMCLAMNGDFAKEMERVASTSNRNFEGRQGRGSRTHLMSPALAAAASIKGYLVNYEEFKELMIS